jgi:hypothetical protein
MDLDLLPCVLKLQPAGLHLKPLSYRRIPGVVTLALRARRSAPELRRDYQRWNPAMISSVASLKQKF